MAHLIMKGKRKRKRKRGPVIQLADKPHIIDARHSNKWVREADIQIKGPRACRVGG